MGKISAKLTTVIGAISAALGTLGTIIAELGLCACFWAPFLSLAGVFSITMAFLSENKWPFMILGLVLLSMGFVMHKKKKICKRHKK